jgi:RsiW-degrading membrane proteinase PrsW (M82 family)
VENILIIIFTAAIPSLILVLYFYNKDKNRKEPGKLIWKIFFIGFLSVIPAAAIELVLSLFIPNNRLLEILYTSFIMAAIVEEGVKFGVVRLFIYDHPKFDEISDGIIYTIIASLGFAFLENIIYEVAHRGAWIIRGFTAVPLHGVASGIMGYYIGLSKFRNQNFMFKGFIYAVLIHGLYDFFIFTNTFLAFLVIPLLIISYRILFQLNKKSIKEDMAHLRIDSLPK